MFTTGYDNMGKFFPFSSYFINYYLQNAHLLRGRGGLMAWASRRVVHASRAHRSYVCIFEFYFTYILTFIAYRYIHHQHTKRQRNEFEISLRPETWVCVSFFGFHLLVLMTMYLKLGYVCVQPPPTY
jgi:hypothetical protein